MMTTAAVQLEYGENDEGNEKFMKQKELAVKIAVPKVRWLQTLLGI